MVDQEDRRPAGAPPRALIVTGYGLNCEAETSYALRLAGARPAQAHLSDLVAGEIDLGAFELLVLIGGFSFGDHLGAGKVLANRLRYRLGTSLEEFIDSSGLVIGICNGFQVLVKLGLLPGGPGRRFEQRCSLTHNDVPGYRDAWIRVSAEPRSPCIFTRGVEQLDLPVRHGEGKFYAPPDVFDELESRGQIALRYVDPQTGRPTGRFPDNPNGSVGAVAGICDPTGRIFGLMPHPEAYHSPLNHPHWRRRAAQGIVEAEGQGIRFFRNAVEHLRSRGAAR